MPNFSIARKGGYEPSEVDSYIRSIETQLNEFRDKSSAINKAIINAQVAADKMIKSANDEAANILKNANDEKAKILADAQNAAGSVKKSATSQLTQLKTNISSQRALVSTFQQDLEALQNKYLKNFAATDITSMLSKLKEVDNLIDGFGNDDDGSKNADKPKPYAKLNTPVGTPEFEKPASDTVAPTAEVKPDVNPYQAKPAPNTYAPSEASAEASAATADSNYQKPGVYRVTDSES